jgi:hypothetical protein
MGLGTTECAIIGKTPPKIWATNINTNNTRGTSPSHNRLLSIVCSPPIFIFHPIFQIQCMVLDWTQSKWSFRPFLTTLIFLNIVIIITINSITITHYQLHLPIGTVGEVLGSRNHLPFSTTIPAPIW